MQRPLAIFPLLTLAAAGPVACGRLADESYRGEPLATVLGHIEGTAPANGRVLLAVHWLRPAECAQFFKEFPLPLRDGKSVSCAADTTATGGCAGLPTSGASTCREVDSLSPQLAQVVDHELGWGGTLSVRLYGLPPDAALYDLTRQGGGGTLAIGRLVATEDENGDGQIGYGTPENAPERAIAESAAGGPPDPAAQDPVSVGSRFVTFLDGAIERSSLRATVRADEPFEPPQGYGIWVENRVFSLGRAIAVYLRADAGGGFGEAVPLTPYLERDQRAVWCGESRIETRWLDAIPAGEAPGWCEVGGRVATWERTTATGPCTFLRERFSADYSCSPDAPPWAGSCP